MIKLKKNKPVKHNGIYYDLSGYDQAKLWRVYDDNPMLRYLFEIVADEDMEIKFFKNKPEGQTEEEFFNETVKGIVKPKRKKK